MNYKDYCDDEEDKEIYSSSKRDISSHSREYEDIYSGRRETDSRPVTRPPVQSVKKKRKKRKKHTVRRITAVILCGLIIFAAAFYGYAYKIISKINRVPLDTDNLAISTDNYKGVRNIALLGLDTRKDDNVGRSDAVLILTVDKKHKKLKLTSIARDTYVEIEGHNKDKLTHAYAYGRSQLAVNTLNRNFGLEITDYVTINFFGLARIIDYMGGIEADIDAAQMKELNSNIFPEMRTLVADCPDITETGMQTLNGAQAVCYARIRHTDNDIMRGNRQKEVLTAMFNKAKKMGIFKMPKLAEMILGECETSLSTNDIMSMGIWAVLSSPKIEQISLPNDNIPSGGKTINGRWCYVYDLKKAEAEMYDFIFEENYYAPDEVKKREVSSSK